MRLVPLALTILLVTCGCASTPAPRGRDGTRTGAAEPTSVVQGSPMLGQTRDEFGTPLSFGAAIRLPVGEGLDGVAYEPSITADLGGNIIITAAHGFLPPHGSWLWVSSDGGETFRTAPPIDGTHLGAVPAGAEGHVSANREGASYFIDLVETAGVSISRSLDGGKTWELRAGNAALPPAGDRPWVAALPGDEVAVLWTQVPSGDWIFVSRDGGRTFPIQTPLLDPGAGNAFPVFAQDGTLYVVQGSEEGPVLLVSQDAGRTFARHLAWKSEGGVGFLISTGAVDDAGTLYVSTVEQRADATRVRYAYSTDHGETFSAPREVTAQPGVHVYQWSAAGAPGHFAVAFYENPEGRGTPAASAGPWYLRVASSDRADRPDAVFREARVTPEPVVRGPVCPGGTVDCRGNQGRRIGDYVGLAVSPEGALHVGWTVPDGGSVFAWYARTPGIGSEPRDAASLREPR